MQDRTLTTEYEIPDAVDEFCYDVAQAVRRVLGLDNPETREEEEDV